MSIPISVADTTFIIATVAKPVTVVNAVNVVAPCKRQRGRYGRCIRQRWGRVAEPPRSAAPQATRDAKADAGVGAVVTVRAK